MAETTESTPFSDFGDVPAEYAAILQDVAVIDLGCRDRIELLGNDRATLLHNLCTNEIRKLPVGAGCEAFFLNVQGKILAHTLVLCRAESLILETVGGAADGLLEHLERYHIREAVEMFDRTAEWSEIFVAGPRAKEILASVVESPLPTEHLTGIELNLVGITTSAWRFAVGPLEGYLLFMPREQSATVLQVLIDRGALPAGMAALDAARIEIGWPVYGRDISDHNLPQELNRDARAISFVKGCYLGQETVARIDALGHVNRLLVGIRFEGSQVPPPGTALTVAGKSVGETTSACQSPHFGGPMALAYVRRGEHTVGRQLESVLGPAVVVELGQGY